MSIFSHACNCMGPQNGDPVCPCQMRNVRIIDGRYVMVRDLGPVSNEESMKNLQLTRLTENQNENERVFTCRK